MRVVLECGGMTAGYAIFETAIGPCGIAWTAAGICAVALPDAASPAARARLAQRSGGDETALPPAIAATVADIVALLNGTPHDLMDAGLDLNGVGDFEQKVYALARAIPPGETRTYGALARDLGDVALSRAVGQTLGANPFPIIVPCHRILAASGRTGGFSAPGGVDTKMRMLSIERARTSDAPLLFDDLDLARAPR